MTMPSWAANMLKSASMVENTVREPNAKAKAIDRVIQHLRTVIPEHFHEDNHEQDDCNQRTESESGTRPLQGKEHRQRG
jgi:hypothetical protein